MKLYWLVLPCCELPARVSPFRCLPTTTASGQWMNLKKTSLQVSVTELCDPVSSTSLAHPSWVIPPSRSFYSVYAVEEIWSAASWLKGPVAHYHKSQITAGNIEEERNRWSQHICARAARGKWLCLSRNVIVIQFSSVVFRPGRCVPVSRRESAGQRLPGIQCLHLCLWPDR